MEKFVATAILLGFLYLLSAKVVVPAYNNGQELASMSNDQQAATTYILQNTEAATGNQVISALKQTDVEIKVDFIEKDDISKNINDSASSAEIARVEESALFDSEKEIDPDGNVEKITYKQIDLSK